MREELSLSGSAALAEAGAAAAGGRARLRRAPRVVGAVAFAHSISQNVTARLRRVGARRGGEDARSLGATGGRTCRSWWCPPRTGPSSRRCWISSTRPTNGINDGQLATVVLPRVHPRHWWESLLHNQTAWLIKAALLYGRRYMNLERVIIDVPFHLKL